MNLVWVSDGWVEVPTDGVIPVTCAECGESFEQGQNGVVLPRGFNSGDGTERVIAWMVLVHEECQ